MKKRLVPLAAAVLLLGAMLVWGYRHYRHRSDLVLSGAIEARDVEVGSLVGGRVVAVHADEGDQVTRGQPLVTFETDMLDLQLAEQQGRVAEVRANLTKALRGPRVEEKERARVEWANAERERARLDALRKEGIVPRQQYDDAAAKAASLREIYEQLQRGSRPEDIAAARAAVEREEGRLRYLQRQRKETVVTAPADGVIESMDLRPGDLVAAGRPVATLLEPSQIWVRVYVPEPKLGLVRVGQRAWPKVDNYPDRRFPGRIVEISNQAEYMPRNVQTMEQRSDQVFGVKVEIDPRPELKPGMAALVTLEP
jgi:multidrug resistance efflux pump